MIRNFTHDLPLACIWVIVGVNIVFWAIEWVVSL